MITRLLFRVATRFFTSIGFVFCLLLAPSQVQGQANFGFEVGAGPDLSLNRETFNDPSNDLVSAANLLGYHYYLEGVLTVSKHLSTAMGYSNSMVNIGNRGNTVGAEIEAIYLRPTYHFICNNRFSLGLSILTGLRYHNHGEGFAHGHSWSGINGQVTNEREASFGLLIKRHEKALLFGAQAGLNYKLPDGISSFSLNVAATSSMKKLMGGYIWEYDIAYGTDRVEIGNWGEMVYFTLGYRITIPLKKASS